MNDDTQNQGDNPGPRGHEKVIPIRPDVDPDTTAAASDAPETEAPIVALEDVNTFGALIVDWFEQRKHDLKNLLVIPAGMEVELTDNDDPAAPIEKLVLEGNTLKAFRLGVHSAMAVLGELPFGRFAEDSDTSDASEVLQALADVGAVNTEAVNDQQPE